MISAPLANSGYAGGLNLTKNSCPAESFICKPGVTP